VALFVFLAVAVWADRRRKERETAERYATFRAMLQTGATDQVLGLMEQDRREARQANARDKWLGGLIVTVVGIAATFVLFLAARGDERGDSGLFLVGLLPVAIGLILLYHARTLRTAATDDERPGPSR
jgi:protein-S-isoprenylcysteine O-methyltransferase Ste14